MELVLIVYTVWSVYSGYRFLTGRNEWLDRRKPASIAVKVVLSLIIGYFIAAFYLIYLILKFISSMAKM